jgi:polar amino acid transport system substrate-binding protein
METQTRRIFLRALTTGIPALILAGCLRGKETVNTFRRVRGTGKLRVGVLPDDAPFASYYRNLEWHGFEITLAKRLEDELERHLGCKVQNEFVPLDFNSRATFLREDKVDIVLARYTITKKRAQEVDFGSPYLKTTLGVLAKARTMTVANLKAAGKTLIVNRDTIAHAFFRKEYPTLKLLVLDKIEDAYSALKNGAGDAFADDLIALLARCLKPKPGENFLIVEHGFGGNDVIAPAVRKGDTEFLTWLNTLTDALHKEGFFKKIYDSELKPYYGTAIPDNYIIL